MDSIVGFDPTLPLDLDGSSNPDHLPEVTFGNHLEYQDGSIPMVTKQNNGRMSPIRARTMKEYDQQIAELKKENFSLKLRIYFLEERMQQKFGDGDVFKTNIELKVQVESLKKELMDKHELLKKASTAMESLTSNHEMELNQYRSQIEQEKKKESSGLQGQLTEAQQKIGHLELEKQGFELELQKAQDMEHKFTTELGDYKKLLLTRDKEKGELEADLEAAGDKTRTLTDQLQEKQGELDSLQGQTEQLQRELDRRDRDMNQLSCVLKEEKAVSSDSFLTNSHLQDKVDDQRLSLDKLQVKMGQLQDQLADKDDTIGKLEDALRNIDKKHKDQQGEMEKMKGEMVRHDENRLKRDKTIQGLVAALHEKNNETKTLEDIISKSREELAQMRDDLHAARMAKHKDAETHHYELDARDSKLNLLEQNLQENELKLEDLMRALGKKDGELCNFKDLLKKAEDALKKSDTAVENLHAQLMKERDEVKDRLDNQAQHYKRLLGDAESELRQKGDLLRTVEDRLKDKDRQLQEYVDLLAQDGKQTDFTDLHKTIGEKNAELRTLRQRLAGQDKLVEDLKKQLQTAEDAIEAMDEESRGKGEHIRQLTGKLRSAQGELEAAVDGQMQANSDRSRAVKHLEGLLADKDAALQDALEFNTSDGSRLKLLRDQLKEKDKLLEELMNEKNRSVLDSERANRDLVNKLKEKNGSTDDMKLYKLLEDQLQEIRHLSELLMKEKQIFITLNQDMGSTATGTGSGTGAGTGAGAGEGREGNTSRTGEAPQDQSAAFLTELAAVQALRQQLQEGVERNNNLRLVLEHQITGPASVTGQAPAQGHQSPGQAQPGQAHSGQSPLGQGPGSSLGQAQTLIPGQAPAISPQGQSSVGGTYPGQAPQGQAHGHSPGQAHPSLPGAQASASVAGGYPGVVNYTNTYNHHYQRHSDSSPEWEKGLRPEFESHARSRSSQRESGYHEISGGSDRHLHGQKLGEKPLTNSRCVGTSPRQDQRSVQTSPFPGVQTHSRSTGTSPQFGHYKSVHTSPISVDPSISLGLLTPSSESENNLPNGYESFSPKSKNLSLKRSPHINFHDAQTSPIASINELVSPNSSLSSGLGTAASGIDTESLSKMSSSMLRKLVQQLQEDLVGALKQNHELQDQVFGECGVREIPGRNDTDPTMADFQQMQKQVQELRSSLERRSKENEVLRSHLGLDQTAQLDLSSLPYLNDLENEVHRMKVQLKDVRQANELLKKQINLSSQSEDYPSGFNPALIVDMAREIEALKSELEKSRKLLAGQRQVFFDQSKKGETWKDDATNLDMIDGASSSGVNSASQSSSSTSVKSGGKSSQIPRLKPRAPMTSIASHEHHPLILERQLKDAQDQIKQVENTLAATEETVRYQSQKVKYYRGLLKDAGIVPLLDSRSQSETCLSKLSPQKSWRGSSESLSPAKNIHDSFNTYRNVSLESVRDYGNTDNVKELKHQIKDMQSKLEKSFSLVHRYQSASPSRGTSPVRRSPSANGRLTLSTDNISQLCQMSGSLEKLQKQVRSLEAELQDSRTLNQELQDQLKELQVYRALANSPSRIHHDQNQDQFLDPQAYRSSMNSHDQLRDVGSQNSPVRLSAHQDKEQSYRSPSRLSIEQDQLRDQSSPSKPGSSVAAMELEISSLRKQLVNSQNVNTVLKNELEELSQFLSELMVHDQNGHSNSHVGLADVSNIRDKLDHSLDVLRTTSSEMSVCEAQPVPLPPVSVSSSNSDVQVQDKYQQLLHSNQQLRKQLAQLQDMYRVDLHNKSLEIQQLQMISERFQKELESSGRSKHSGEADGSPVASRRVSGWKKSDAEAIDSSSPCDGLPHPLYPHLTPTLSRVSGPLVKSGSMESDDIAEIHKMTDENYGRPLRDSGGDTSFERIRNHSGGSPNSEGRKESETSMDKLRHRTMSGATACSRPSTEGQFVRDSTVFTNSPGIPERSFQRTVTDNNDFTMFSNTSVGGLSYDLTLRDSEAHNLTNRKSYCESETSSRERSQTPTTEVNQLQARLHAMEDLNLTLKGELSIYETLYKSMGVQGSPGKSMASQASPGKSLLQESFSRPGSLDDLTLKQHLAEIRAMRKRLEEGLDQNDKIRDELLHKLEDSEGPQEHLHTACERKIHELERTLRHLQEELTSRQASISEKIFLIDEREKIIHDTKIIIKKQRKEAAERESMMEKLQHDLSRSQSVLEKYQTEMMEKEKSLTDREKSLRDHEKTLSDREKTIRHQEKMFADHEKSLSDREKTMRHQEKTFADRERSVVERERGVVEREKTIVERETRLGDKDHRHTGLQQKKEKLETMLKKASKEIKRLNLELCNLRERDSERTELNKSLRLELSVYEKLKGNQKENDETSCIHELLLEVQRLRRQLERSIDSNGLLRSKLEEMLEHKHERKLNRSPAGSLTTDAPDGRPSPESTLRHDPLEGRTKETYIRNFLSEKEYKFNVITRESGLHGEEDHLMSDFTSTTTESHKRTTRENSAEKHSSKGQEKHSSFGQEIHMSQSLSIPTHDMTKESSMMSLPDDLGQVARRRHLASMENLKYWVDSSPADAMKDFPIVRVDSDIRRLFAIGKIDDFEKLRKENSEMQGVLSGIQARVSDRLKTLKSKPISENVDYSTLREIEMATENLHICMKEEKRLISAFWLSQLPPINELGEFFDPKLASENSELKEHLVKLRSQYDLSKLSLREANERLKATNKQRADMEGVLYKQLSKTYKVLEKAETNLERSAKESGFKIPSTSVHSKHRSSKNKPL